MHRQDTRGHDTPDTATESGLSTDDLARPHDRATEDTSGPPPDAPMFPGESAATPSDAPEREDDAGFDGTGREGTGRADTGREGARGAEDTGRAGSGRDTGGPDDGAEGTDTRAESSRDRTTGGSRDAQDADDTPNSSARRTRRRSAPAGRRCRASSSTTRATPCTPPTPSSRT